MIYLSQMLGIPVVDADGEEIGKVNDLGVATGEVFPRVTSLAFVGPGRTPFMISWRKYVESFDDDAVRLKVPATDIRFSYLQPEELLIARDLLNKQIVDTKGMRVVRVNDLKLSDSGTGGRGGKAEGRLGEDAGGSANQLRLLGAEVGARGILRSLHPALERGVCRAAAAVGHPIPERIIAWSYMDLLDRELKDVKLSVSHKTLDELHPADIADILEQLDPRLRGQVFAQLDAEQAADAMAELDDDQAAEIVDDMDDRQASRMLQEMDPDDAAELVSELDYAKAETLLRLMGVKEQRAIRQLLGYRENTAGRIMTSAVVSFTPQMTVEEAVERLRAAEADDIETVNYLYVTDEAKRLQGVLPLKDLLLAEPGTRLSRLMETELVTCDPEDDQEDVADAISKYNLLALPVVDEDGKLLGIITVDDALEVLEEEHEEDLMLAGGREAGADESSHTLTWLLDSQLWFFFWLIGVALTAAASLAAGQWLAWVLLCAFMPVALLAADAMVDYAVGFFIEFDADDEDAPSLALFLARGLAMGIVYAILVALLSGFVVAIFLQGSWDAALSVLMLFGLLPTVVSMLASFASAPIYVRALRRRDAAGKDSRRIALRMVAFCVAIAIYLLVLWPMLMLG